MNLPKLIYSVDTLDMKPMDYEIPAEMLPALLGKGYLYFWKLSNIWKAFPELKPLVQGDNVIIKIGYAKAPRVIGRNKNGRRYGIGAVARARESIRAWEKAFDLDQGSIRARLYVMALGEVNEMLAAEQSLHSLNQGSDIWFTPWIEEQAASRNVAAPAGKTEYYLARIQTLYAKFLACQTKASKAKGWAKMKANGFKGPSGWTLPINRNGESL